MSLEILEAGSPSDRPSLLFVHGSFSGAWVWAEHFLPHFAARGWHCRALSLRGHGGSDGHQDLDCLGMEDFLADVAEAVRGLPHPPVIVGHSLGGMLAQHHACRHPVAGMVLIGSLGPSGLGATMAHMAIRHPDLLAELARMQTQGLHAGNYDVIRRGLFSADFPAEEAWRFVPRFHRESHRVSWELTLPQWPALAWHRPVRTLVIGGGADSFIPLSEVNATAWLWGAESRILSDAPHVMMLDHTWRQVAAIMEEWLEPLGGRSDR